MKNLITSFVLAMLVAGLAMYSLSSPTAQADETVQLHEVQQVQLNDLAITDSAAATADALSVITAGSAVGAPQFGGIFDRPAQVRGMIWTFNHSVYIP